MEIIVEPEAEEDLKQFDRQSQQYIKDRLEELKKQPTGHEDSDTIRVKGRQLFKYVMKENDKRGGNDYRAVYDIIDRQVRIIAVFHRDKGYSSEELSKRT